VRAEDNQFLPLLAVPVNVFDDFEIYGYCRQIQHLHRAVGAREQIINRTQAVLDAARADLAEAMDAVEGLRQARGESEIAIEALRAELAAA
jgi:hypothetical protein